MYIYIYIHNYIYTYIHIHIHIVLTRCSYIYVFECLYVCVYVFHRRLLFPSLMMLGLFWLASISGIVLTMHVCNVVFTCV